jgi:hypothetical protein
MSLQSKMSVDYYSARCTELWKSWLTGATPAARKTAREGKIRSALGPLMGFMVPVAILFEDLDDSHGAFSWTRWRLYINSDNTKDDDITYEDFIELCSTGYHETRHAEQFYRIAQGLALGKLSFPDKSKAQIIQQQQGLGMGTGFKAKVAMFEGKGMQQSSRSQRAQQIQEWLDIPITVARTAEAAKGGFDGYIGLAKPQWFKRKTVLLEVEDWMRSTFKKTLGEMGAWAQSDAGPYKIYKGLPEEHDAHSIEALVVSGITTRIGHTVQQRGAQPRTNTALFGA